MADAVGLEGLHSVTGLCDLCGSDCDAITQELNALDCTFPNCPSESNIYHQDCLEKYLRSIKLEKSRKTGFKCPRGCGRGTIYAGPCPGRVKTPLLSFTSVLLESCLLVPSIHVTAVFQVPSVLHLETGHCKGSHLTYHLVCVLPLPQIDKSHPIISRSQAGKKRRKGRAPEPSPQQCMKERAAPSQAHSKDDPEAAKQKSKESDAKPKVAPRMASTSSKADKELSREQMQALALAAKRELGLVQVSKSEARATSSTRPKETQTLEEYERTNALHRMSAAAPRVPVISAWARPPSVPVTLQPHKLDVSVPVPRSLPWPSTGPLYRSASSPAQDVDQTPWRTQQKGSWASAAQSPSPVLVAPPPAPPQQQVSQATVPGNAALQPWALSLYHGKPAPQQLGGLSNTHKPPTAVSDVDGMKLKKAHKKNLKRKEKKAAQQQSADWTDTASENPPATTHMLSQAEVKDDWEIHNGTGTWSHCVYLMRTSKLKVLVERFSQLGFAEWQAHSAIARYGSSSIDAAAGWLLETDGLKPEDCPTAAAVRAAIDIDSELSVMRELPSTLGCSVDAIVAALLECGGAPGAAVELLYDRCDAPAEEQKSSWHQNQQNTTIQQQSQNVITQHLALVQSQQQRQQQQQYLSHSASLPRLAAITNFHLPQKSVVTPQQQPQRSSQGMPAMASSNNTDERSYLYQPLNPNTDRGFLSPATLEVQNEQPKPGASLLAGGLFGRLRGSQPQEFMHTGNQGLTLDKSPAASIVNGGYLTSQTGEAGSASGSWNATYSSLPAREALVSPDPLPASSYFADNQGILESPDELFVLSASCAGDSEFPANLAPGSELLGFVCTQGVGKDMNNAPDLPAFFAGAPVLYDTPLEEPGDSGHPCNAEVAEASRALPQASTVQLGEDGGSWGQVPECPTMWSEPATGRNWAAQEIPKAALMAAAGVLDDTAMPGTYDGIPDDHELDALMATLVCR